MHEAEFGLVGEEDRWSDPWSERQKPVCGVVGCVNPAFLWLRVTVDRAKQRAKVLMVDGELNLCEDHTPERLKK